MTITNFLYFRYVSNEKKCHLSLFGKTPKMSFVSFWKKTKKKCFWKKSKIGLNSFWKKQKMSFVSFWNKMWPKTMFKTHFASVHGWVRTVSKGECCCCTMLDSTTVGHPPRPPPLASNCGYNLHGVAQSGVAQSRLSRLLLLLKGVIISLSIGTQR